MAMYDEDLEDEELDIPRPMGLSDGGPPPADADLVRQFILARQTPRKYDTDALRAAQGASNDALLGANIADAGSDAAYAIAGVKNPNPGAFEGLKKQSQLPVEQFDQGRQLETQDRQLGNQADRTVLNYIARQEAAKAARAQAEARAKQTERSFEETSRHNRATEKLLGDKTVAAIDAKANKMPSGDQFKAATFAQRLEDSAKVMEELEAGGFDRGSLENQAISKLPDFIRGPIAGSVDPRLTQQEQAERNFVNAVLRRESGSAIESSEFTSAEQQYFVRPGDSPETKAQKLRNREVALAGLRAEAGKASENLASRLPQQTGRTVVKRQRNPQQPGKVRLVYSDGSTEIVDE